MTSLIQAVVPVMYQTLFALVLAVSLRYLVQSVGGLRGPMLQVSPRTTEAARSLGEGTVGVLRTITLPLLRPTIQTAVILRLISAIQIWLIMVILLGFSRLPVLVERIVFYHDEVSGLDVSYQMALGYTIIVSVIVSLAALLYLQVSGAFKPDTEEAL